MANGVIGEDAQPRLLLSRHTRKTEVTLAGVPKQDTTTAAALWGPWVMMPSG